MCGRYSIRKPVTKTADLVKTNIKVEDTDNYNAPKLIEKYNDLAREALSNGDKILSENYLQHADHFTRVLNEKESFKRDSIVIKEALLNEKKRGGQSFYIVPRIKDISTIEEFIK